MITKGAMLLGLPLFIVGSVYGTVNLYAGNICFGLLGFAAYVVGPIFMVYGAKNSIFGQIKLFISIYILPFVFAVTTYVLYSILSDSVEFVVTIIISGIITFLIYMLAFYLVSPND